jgi:uncharacterized membrane protein YdjX (TVP38/TMEM64 family)
VGAGHGGRDSGSGTGAESGEGTFGSRLGPVALSLIPAALLVIAFGAALVASPGLRAEMVTVWELLREGEAEPLRDWLRGFGAWAPVVSGLLQLATSIFPPGPSFLLSIANAMLYGALWGGLLTFVTALVAAAVCFGIARVVGRPGVERLVSPETLAKVDGFMERRGMLAVFLARLIPFINPDVTSYAAGVTGIRWVPFLLAMAAGALPATAFYSVVGAAAIEAAGWVVVMVMVATILPLLALLFIRKRVFGGEG